MSDNKRGDLLIGAGVVAKGTMTAPGLVEVDGSVDGILRANSVNVTANGVVTGDTTADNIRVAGQLLDKSTARNSLLVESTGQVSGDIAYGDLEIRKGGNIVGKINSRAAT
jgi:cytoskeletal protein CcmA (bactofilin family)